MSNVTTSCVWLPSPWWCNILGRSWSGGKTTSPQGPQPRPLVGMISAGWWNIRSSSITALSRLHGPIGCYLVCFYYGERYFPPPFFYFFFKEKQTWIGNADCSGYSSYYYDTTIESTGYCVRLWPPPPPVVKRSYLFSSTLLFISECVGYDHYYFRRHILSSGSILKQILLLPAVSTTKSVIVCVKWCVRWLLFPQRLGVRMAPCVDRGFVYAPCLAVVAERRCFLDFEKKK